MSELTKLPNIGETLAGKLEAVGITDLEALTRIGSVDALLLIGEHTGSGCYNMLYALEGAIQGIRWHGLAKQERQQLKEKLDSARQGH